MLSGSVTASSTALSLNPPCRVGGSIEFAGGRDHPSLNPLAQDLARGMQMFPQHQPSVVHNCHHSYQGARSAPFERQWYTDVITRISLCRYSSKLPPPHFVQGRSELLLLVFRKLQTKSISPPLLGKASPCYYTACFLLSRIAVGQAAAKSSEGSQKSETFPSATATGKDSPAVSLRDLLCRAYTLQ